MFLYELIAKTSRSVVSLAEKQQCRVVKGEVMEQVLALPLASCGFWARIIPKMTIIIIILEPTS